MSADNGIVSNVQIKTFGGLQKTFGVFWFYFRALLMTKDLLDAKFKNELPETEYAEGQSKKEKENCSKNRQVMGFFSIIDFREMDDQGRKIENRGLAKWSCIFDCGETRGNV